MLADAVLVPSCSASRSSPPSSSARCGSPNPLLDVRLYANKAFAAASVTMSALGAALFGAMVLMPLYFQLVRGEDAVKTGLLLIPQGIGAALAMAALRPRHRAPRRRAHVADRRRGHDRGHDPVRADRGRHDFVLISRGDDRARLRHRHVDDAVDDRRLRVAAPRAGQRRDAAAQRAAARRRLDRHRDPDRRAPERHQPASPHRRPPAWPAPSRTPTCGCWAISLVALLPTIVLTVVERRARASRDAAAGRRRAGGGA